MKTYRVEVKTPVIHTENSELEDMSEDDFNYIESNSEDDFNLLDVGDNYGL